MTTLLYILLGLALLPFALQTILGLIVIAIGLIISFVEGVNERRKK